MSCLPGYSNKLNKFKCRYPSGKVLGGTSAFNYILNVTGNEKDYDRWGSERSKSRNNKSVIEYFKESEDMKSQESLLSSLGYHSTGGYLKLENYHTRESETFYAGVRKGLKEVSYDSYPVCNGGNQTDKGLLSPIKGRTNLKVTKLSLASKLLIDKNKRVYGVEFINNGFQVNVRTTK